MKIHPKAKIELIASDDPTRPAISEPYLDIRDGKGTLVATTGIAMAMVPVEVDPADTSGYVATEALVAARKIARDAATVDLADSAMAKLPSGAPLQRNGTAGNNQFPNWRQVVSTMPDKPEWRVALNAKALWELAQAMGTTRVELIPSGNVLHVLPVQSDTRDSNKAPCYVPDARGVLMVVRLPERTNEGGAE